MLKLKLQNFGHCMWRADSLEKILMLGKIEGRRRKGGGDTGGDGWMISLTQWTWVWANSRRQWRTRKPGVLQFMELPKVRDNWATEQHCHLYFPSLCLDESYCIKFYQFYQCFPRTSFWPFSLVCVFINLLTWPLIFIFSFLLCSLFSIWCSFSSLLS